MRIDKYSSNIDILLYIITISNQVQIMNRPCTIKPARPNSTKNTYEISIPTGRKAVVFSNLGTMSDLILTNNALLLEDVRISPHNLNLRKVLVNPKIIDYHYVEKLPPSSC